MLNGMVRILMFQYLLSNVVDKILHKSHQSERSPGYSYNIKNTLFHDTFYNFNGKVGKCNNQYCHRCSNNQQVIHVLNMLNLISNMVGYKNNTHSPSFHSRLNNIHDIHQCINQFQDSSDILHFHKKFYNFFRHFTSNNYHYIPSRSYLLFHYKTNMQCHRLYILI